MTTLSALKLQMPLFYLSEAGIRFEIGDPNLEIVEGYIEKAHERTMEIFHHLFSQEDDILFVVNDYFANEEKMYDEELVNWREYQEKNPQAIRGKAIIDRFFKREGNGFAIEQNIPYPYGDDDEDLESENKGRSYTLPCKIKELNVSELMKSIILTDFPSLGGTNIWSECYFFDIRRNLVLHLYDHRGMDVVASDKETLRDIYETFNRYILEHDREKIDNLFKKETI